MEGGKDVYLTMDLESEDGVDMHYLTQGPLDNSDRFMAMKVTVENEVSGQYFIVYLCFFYFFLMQIKSVSRKIKLVDKRNGFEKMMAFSTFIECKIKIQRLLLSLIVFNLENIFYVRHLVHRIITFDKSEID